MNLPAALPRIVGAKLPLRPMHVWTNRVRLQIERDDSQIRKSVCEPDRTGGHKGTPPLHRPPNAIRGTRTMSQIIPRLTPADQRIRERSSAQDAVEPECPQWVESRHKCTRLPTSMSFV